jgi:sporulation protein YlmC with PRC-barrel domain
MRLSTLLDLPVRTESGDELGRLFDLRAKEVGGRWRVTGLIVGSYGVLERIGAVGARRTRETRGTRAASDFVPWDAVVRIRPDAVVVRDGTEAS